MISYVHIQPLKYSWAFVFLLIVSCNQGNSERTSEIELTTEEWNYMFVSDDIFHGIIPSINECWTLLLTALGQGDLGHAEHVTQSFWNEIFLKKLRSYHVKIREIDEVVLANRPSKVLNNAVNVTTLIDAINLSKEVFNQTVDWIETVKDGWIEVAGMMKQLHFKYDLTFDHLHAEGQSGHVEDDFLSMNETLSQYFLWYNIRDLNVQPESRSSNDLVLLAKEVMSGNIGPEKNLFVGLKELLRLEEKRLTNIIDQQPNSSSICSGNETLGGKRGKILGYLPVYILLHLLNAEFKYYIMRNVVHMFRCIRSKNCDSTVSVSSEEHLRKFYGYYFDGVLLAFTEKNKEEPLPSSTPKRAWRWRCDPPIDINATSLQVGKRQHIEDVTFARFYDYQTLFVAEERDLSLSKTCRDSCDMFDGGYSSIPCEDDDWDCLEAEKDFDCFELRKQGVQCPGKARTMCPNGGIKCITSKMNKVQVCSGQSNWRHIEWLERGVGTIMGKQTPCNSTGMTNISSSTISERSGITRYEPQSCEICMCKCYEPLSQRTHRYISLVPQIANVQNQQALVGVKFIKIGSVIYPKIAQAKVKYGMPNVSTVEWIQPIPIDNLSDTSQIFRLGRNAKNILLDDFLAPVGYAITGLRFVTVNHSIQGDYELDTLSNVHVIFPVYGNVGVEENWSFRTVEKELALEVHMTELNELGDLKPETTIWKSNVQNTSLFRKQVMMDDPDQPNLSQLPSLTNSSSNQFISIQTTSVKKDVGQTPVPFFDTQELIEEENMTLTRGLGLFYKAQPGYGGFLAFRMISMPMSDTPKNHNYDLWHSKRRLETP